MNFFPQLDSGAIAQYSVEIKRRFRTASTETIDGRQVQWSDASAQSIEWKCEYSDLSPDEWNALENLHTTVEGQLQTFTFFDPLDNLLLWSESFSNSVWQKDPYFNLSTGVSDPLGGTNGFHVTNSGVVAQQMTQSIAIPGSYTASFSVWAKGSALKLIHLASGAEASFPASANWTRIDATFFGGVGETSVFGFSLAPSAVVDLFGAQVDAQPATSTYKKTGNRGGIYPYARFAEDRLRAVAIAPNRYGCTVRVQARLGA